jgi:general secretion pathway protein C
MSARLVAFVVWAAVAACAAYWGLRLIVTPRPVPSQAQSVSMSAAQRGDIAKLFAEAPTASATQVEPGLAARFKLVGVMAPKDADAGREQGVALISIDDKPPRAYRVGARVDQALVLQSVAKRSAAIGPVSGAAALQLELPAPAPPATGSLPRAEAILGAGTLPAGPVAAPMPPPVAPLSVAPPAIGMPPNPPPSDPGAGMPTPGSPSAIDAANDPSNRR